jgi:predicted CXXCH cytochrome family protein
MAKEVGSSVKQAVFFIAIVGLISLGYFCLCNCSCRPTAAALASQETAGGYDGTEVLGLNAACYVCHIPFVQEDLSRTHLQAKVVCIDCHGLSAGHANDENIGATPPDVKFERSEVDAMCLKCHKTHGISQEDLAKHKVTPVCTDCHGSHRITKPAAISP